MDFYKEVHLTIIENDCKIIEVYYGYTLIKRILLRNKHTSVKMSLRVFPLTDWVDRIAGTLKLPLKLISSLFLPSDNFRVSIRFLNSMSFKICKSTILPGTLKIIDEQTLHNLYHTPNTKL